MSYMNASKIARIVERMATEQSTVTSGPCKMARRNSMGSRRMEESAAAAEQRRGERRSIEKRRSRASTRIMLRRGTIVIDMSWLGFLAASRGLRCPTTYLIQPLGRMEDLPYSTSM
jgi:hypothetical protein